MKNKFIIVYYVDYNIFIILQDDINYVCIFIYEIYKSMFSKLLYTNDPKILQIKKNGLNEGKKRIL